MRFGYSAKNNAFYFLDEEFAYRENGTWSEDIIPVTDEIFLEFTNNPPEGKKRAPGANGLPVWIDIPDNEERKAEDCLALKNTFLEKADAEIRLLKVVQEVYGLNEDETKKLNAWKKYLAEVYRLNVSLQEKIDWPDAPGNS